MSCALERIISVKQTSMAATALPLELQQQIFQYLDTKSFYSARKVCKYWLFASTDAIPLARQLRRLPILPPADAASSNPTELLELYEEATRTLMVGVTAERAFDRPGSLTRASKLGFALNPRVCATTCGSKTVTLNGRNIALFDISGEKSVCIAQRPINDLKETVGSGPWLKIQPNTYNELALSSNGRMLAIAQERTIQVYDLLAEPDSFTVNQYVSSATGHYICGLDFEQDDHVLRVRLSGKGTVLYLGTPPIVENAGQPASLEHWKSKAGLRHTFLDSSLLTVPSPSEEPDQIARVAGLQLMRPFEDGYLFAAQRHGGGLSSHYILGHVKASVPHNTVALTAEPGNVTILARLESFLSSWSFTLDSASERGVGLWENMPSAHEHHPRYAIDTKNNYLALAERDKKRIRPAPLCQLFIYRIPTEEGLHRTLSQAKTERKEEQSAPLGSSENAEVGGHDQASGQPKYIIPRTPLCLSTIQGDITELVFSPGDDNTCSISASTSETTMTWLLQDS